MDGWTCRFLLNTLGQFVFSLLPSAQENKNMLSRCVGVLPLSSLFFFYIYHADTTDAALHICSQPAASSFSPRSLTRIQQKRLAGLEGEWLSCMIGYGCLCWPRADPGRLSREIGGSTLHDRVRTKDQKDVEDLIRAISDVKKPFRDVACAHRQRACK